MSKEYPTLEEKWEMDSHLIRVENNGKELDIDSIPDIEEGDEDE